MARAQCLAILLSPMETSDALLQLEMLLGAVGGTAVRAGRRLRS